MQHLKQILNHKVTEFKAPAQTTCILQLYLANTAVVLKVA
jgi:hypothetical protein